MKLNAKIESEKGKMLEKSGNEKLFFKISGEDREEVWTIHTMPTSDGRLHLNIREDGKIIFATLSKKHNLKVSR